MGNVVSLLALFPNGSRGYCYCLSDAILFVPFVSPSCLVRLAFERFRMKAVLRPSAIPPGFVLQECLQLFE